MSGYDEYYLPNHISMQSSLISGFHILGYALILLQMWQYQVSKFEIVQKSVIKNLNTI